MDTVTIGRKVYPEQSVEENISDAVSTLIDMGAATGRAIHTEETDALIMLTAVAAIQRGATPLEIQRNVNYFNGID